MTGNDDARDLPPLARVTRRWVWVAAACFVLYAIFLLAEFIAVGVFTIPGEALSAFVTYGLGVAPVAGLALLVRAARGALSVLTCIVLVLSTSGGALLSFYALHVAPPDPLNGVIVVFVALVQFAALIVLGLIWGIGRWRRRRDDRRTRSDLPK